MSTDADEPSQDPIASDSTEVPSQAETPTPAEVPAQAATPAEAPAPALAKQDLAAAPAEPAAPAPLETETQAPAAPEAPPQAEAPSPDAPAKKPAKPKRKRPPRPRKPNIPKDLPRSRAPLPLDELRDASRATLDLFGQKGIRDAFLILAPRERQDISALIAQEEDHRPRTRNIANGSLGAGRIDKAMSATIISMAKVEDLWTLTLDKEAAAEKIGRIRAAKQRDKEKADRAKERANRSDRVSREDMAKARDGSVGATIRIVTDEKRERREKTEKPGEKPQRESVLDKLGY